MKNKIDQRKLYRILYILLYGVMILPLFGGHIPARGDILPWLNRIREVGDRLPGLALFPSVETVLLLETGRTAALNSNLWLLIPGLLFRITGSLTAGYLVYVAALQLVGLLGLKRFFGALLEEEAPALLGTVLAAANPFRIWLLYDRANLGQAAAWAFLPLYLWGLVRIKQEGGLRRGWKYAVAAAVALAAAGYADSLFFCIAAGFTLAAVLLWRCPVWIAALAGGTILWLPTGVRLILFLAGTKLDGYGFPLKSIMRDGYAAGNYLTTWFYEADRPGLGLPVLIAVGVIVWLVFVEQEKSGRTERNFLLLGLLGVLCSWNQFPWDYVQRLGAWALKAVSLIDPPAVFAGPAALCFCVPAAFGAAKLKRHMEEQAYHLFLCVWIALAFAVAIFLCGELTSGTAPLIFSER